MHQQYLSILLKFYQKMVEGSKQGQLLNHSIERFLNFELKQEEKMMKQREGSDIKSFKSGSSNTSLTGFEKVKKLFYSNHMETAILFYYLLKKIKNGEAGAVGRLMGQLTDKSRVIKANYISNEERRKFNTKLGKFIEQVQFLEGKVAQGRAIDWLYFQVFKQFQSQTVMAAQLLSSSGDTLQSKEGIKTSQYAQLLKALRAQCSIFDYSSREVTILGISSGQKLFIGRRSDTFFVLTQKQFEKATSNQAIMGSRKQLQQQKQKQKEREERGKEAKSYSTNKFKEEFLAQMLKLRQGYEVNTATIATLFHFKDAGEGRTLDQANQA